MSTALVFAGGGANGGFGVGVEEVLRVEGGYEWDAVYGVSAGALNALLIAQGRPDQLKRLWLDEIDAVVEKKSFWKYAWGVLTKTSGIYDNTGLERIIVEILSESPLLLPLTVGYVDMASGDYRTATNDNPGLADFIIASTSIPVIFGFHEIGDLQLADGGLRNVTPLKDAIDDGHDEIVVVLNRPSTLRPKGSVKGIAEVFSRTIDILTHEIALNDIKMCEMVNRLVKEAGGEIGRYRYVDLKIIRPSRDLGDSMDFSRSHARESILQGTKDARHALLGNP